jgi:hypothetical protein
MKKCTARLLRSRRIGVGVTASDAIAPSSNIASQNPVAEIGVEGRTKTHYHTAPTILAYRCATDDAAADEMALITLLSA